MGGMASWSVAFSPCGRHLAAANNTKNYAEMWDVESGRHVRQFDAPYGEYGDVYSIAFSSDGKYIATGSGHKTTTLWNANDGTHVINLNTQSIKRGGSLTPHSGHSEAVTSVAFSYDGTLLATGSKDHTAIVWNITNISSVPIVHTLKAHDRSVNKVTFSRKNILATTSTDEVKLWDMSGQCVASFAPNIWTIAFSPGDHHCLATGSDSGHVTLWDLGLRSSRPRERFSFAAHSKNVTCLAFSPDGVHLATGSEDRTANIWEVASSTLVHTFGRDALGGPNPFTGHILSIAFSPDGKHVATGSKGKDAVKLWKVTPTSRK